jgi:hypothetical protein
MSCQVSARLCSGLLEMRKSLRISPEPVPDTTAGRWLLVLGAGVVIAALGAGYLLVDLYQQARFPRWADPWVQDVTLQFMPRAARGAVFLLAGAAAVLVALRHYAAHPNG